jgi:hypothetical protein
MAQVEGSGTIVGTIAMPSGTPNPEISAAFTVAPAVVYSPIVPVSFVTKRSEPDTAMSMGELNPEISDAFTVAPAVVYSPIVPAPMFVTKRSEPDTRYVNREVQPRDQRADDEGRPLRRSAGRGLSERGYSIGSFRRRRRSASRAPTK